MERVLDASTSNAFSPLFLALRTRLSAQVAHARQPTSDDSRVLDASPLCLNTRPVSTPCARATAPEANLLGAVALHDPNVRAALLLQTRECTRVRLYELRRRRRDVVMKREARVRSFAQCQQAVSDDCARVRSEAATHAAQYAQHVRQAHAGAMQRLQVGPVVYIALCLLRDPG